MSEIMNKEVLRIATNVSPDSINKHPIQTNLHLIYPDSSSVIFIQDILVG